MNRSAEPAPISTAESGGDSFNSLLDEKKAQADLIANPELSKEARTAACKRIMELTIEMNRTNHV